MLGFSLHESSCARQSPEPALGNAASRNDLCEILPREFKVSSKMRLRRTLSGKPGGSFEVNVEISLLPGHAPSARTLSGLLQDSAGECFEYALATPHAKTIASAITDREGRTIGDVVASFRMSRRESVPETDGIPPLPAGVGA
jgi:hypothetical protein